MKLKEDSDFCYANAGKVVHSCLEMYFSKQITDIQLLKELFNKEWEKPEYSLQLSKIAKLKDEYWLMVLNSREHDITSTDTELKISYDDVLAYIDSVDLNSLILDDHKTSKRDEKHEEEYKNQVIFYAWLILRKYNKLIKTCNVRYYKYIGEKSLQTIYPTQEDITKIETWYNNTLKEMEQLSITKVCPSKCKECNPWCSFTKQCSAEDNEFTVKLTIWNHLIFIDCEWDTLLNKQLHKKFSYEQTKDSYMNRKWDKPNPIIDFYNETKHSLPLGFKDQVIKTFSDYAEYKKMKLNLVINDTRKFNEEKISMPEKFINGHELRYYQKDAVKVILDNKIAAIQSSTGSGKTEMSIDVIRQLTYKTLFVVDRKELMKQTIERIESCLGIKVGKLGDSERDLQHVTVGMVQTINSCINNNDTEIIEYLKSVRLTIMDEAHKCSADSYVTLNRYITNSEYKVLMSGTLKRNDGEDMKLYSIAGEIKYSKPARELIDEGILMKPQIFFIEDYMTKEEERQTRLTCSTGLINEQDQYPIFYDKFIVNNEVRNNLIKDVVNVVSKNNKKILILVKLIEHGKKLEQLIPNSKYVYGETPKKEREDIFNSFSKGELNIMITMISIASEGLDWPALELLCQASGSKTDNKIIQGIGRILRKCEGKEQPTYIDFLDYGGMIKNASICRRRALKREGHYIQQITFEEFVDSKLKTQSI
jgi:superfamily II DNA or RNA helicase